MKPEMASQRGLRNSLWKKWSGFSIQQILLQQCHHTYHKKLTKYRHLDTRLNFVHADKTLFFVKLTLQKHLCAAELPKLPETGNTSTMKFIQNSDNNNLIFTAMFYQRKYGDDRFIRWSLLYVLRARARARVCVMCHDSWTIYSHFQ